MYLFNNERSGKNRDLSDKNKAGDTVEKISKRVDIAMKLITAENRLWNKLETECKGDENEIKIRANHESETALDDANFDGYIDNDYNDNPGETCKDFIEEIISSS